MKPEPSKSASAADVATTELFGSLPDLSPLGRLLRSDPLLLPLLVRPIAADERELRSRSKGKCLNLRISCHPVGQGAGADRAILMVSGVVARSNASYIGLDMRALASLIAALMVVLTIQTASAQLEAGMPIGVAGLSAAETAEDSPCLACDVCPASQGARMNCASTSVCASAVAELRSVSMPVPCAQAEWLRAVFADASALEPEPLLSPPRSSLI